MDTIIMTVLLLPLLVMLHVALRLMIGSDREIRSRRSDRIPVKVREQKGKKDQ